MQTDKFKYSLAGLSHDKRTNVWSFVCLKCNKDFRPQTTMMATQSVECPKCGQTEIINYNE